MWPSNQILQVLQDLKTPATVPQLVEATGLTREQVWNSCFLLVKNKLARHPKGAPGVYLITAAGETCIAQGRQLVGGPKGRLGRKGNHTKPFRDRLWLVLRIERKGTVGDLLSLILRDGEDADRLAHNAHAYINNLCKFGYVARLPGRTPGTAVTSCGYVRYILTVDNGPLAPSIRRGDKTTPATLYDPNTKAVVQLIGGAP